MKYFISAILFLITISHADAQRLSESIHLNQVGFYPESPKIAVVTEGEPDYFYILTPDFSDTLYTGQLSTIREAPNSGERVRVADFTDMTEPGNYILWITKLGYSYPFTVAPRVYEDAAKASLKGFYHQRVSAGIPYEYGGKWARPAGHPDTLVVIHPSAASPERPANSVISAPRGWYDAGDYNKYAVNSGITMGTLFSLYEDFPEYIRDFDINIPETGNGLPDLLNELLWNLRWFMDIQDPHDGGVYHKLTTANFEGRVMPAEAKGTRYVIQKSVTGTLNFAAVMAQASRIFQNYENVVPGLADSTLSAAESAWQWALDNPEKLYNQNEMNERFNPDILTGAYGDNDASDEFAWAAAELYITTGNRDYLDEVDLFPSDEASVPTWRSVQTMAYYTLARHSENIDSGIASDARDLVIDLANRLMDGVSETGYRTVMDRDESNYTWGSSGVAANQGMALIQAFLHTDDTTYLKYAHSNLDYLLGRNATGFSFLTGHGHKTPLYIHHRPSDARANIDPVPGLLSGGPNPGQQDECEYPSDLPAKSFIDDWCSYAANEIAINWNAPMVYLSAGLEALQFRGGFTVEDE
ncbi:cellulase [Rhodohalobacter sp. SW132]|uniref:glycoside hydrolase family 9 protein n=1 Tax=Rhodohalobacter sp. SW132 TaxID=2293433 RepID=UPI000E25DFEB|nr:glycoside hydrolase family 9 protein [Rhodohalobacter sp. SW132]REL37648.1 cellulase [Rhodohalobacter sp. SW132]